MARKGKPWYRADRGVWVAKIGGKLVTLGSDESAARLRFNELSSKPLEPTVSDLVAAHLAWVAGRAQSGEVSPHTLTAYRTHSRWLLKHAGSCLASSVRGVDLLGWLTADSHLATSSKASYGVYAKRCFKWACRVGLIGSNPLREVPVPGHRSRSHNLTREDVERAEAAILSPSFRDLFRFLYLTGCRVNEALQLTTDDFDGGPESVVIRKHKTVRFGLERRLFLPLAAQEIVKNAVSEVGVNRVGPVFRNRDGNAWTAFAVNRQFARLSARTGIRIYPHALRSLWATDALCAGVPVSIVAACLGNSPKVLQKHYDRTASRVDLLIEAARKVRA